MLITRKSRCAELREDGQRSYFYGDHHHSAPFTWFSVQCSHAPTIMHRTQYIEYYTFKRWSLWVKRREIRSLWCSKSLSSMYGCQTVKADQISWTFLSFLPIPKTDTTYYSWKLFICIIKYFFVEQVFI